MKSWLSSIGVLTLMWVDMDILCRVTANGLVPMYDSDFDEKKRLKAGETIKKDDNTYAVEEIDLDD